MRKATASSRWVDDDAGLAELAGALSDAGEFAFDTEFHRERTYWPQLALLQVAWEGGVALVDPMAVDIAPLGRCFSSSPRIA